MELDDKTISDIRVAIEHLEDIAGIDRDNWVIIHTISPYSDIDDYYKIIDITKGESMFISDTLEDLLWNLRQMYQ